jgi:hypothetical protein
MTDAPMTPVELLMLWHGLTAEEAAWLLSHTDEGGEA